MPQNLKKICSNFYWVVESHYSSLLIIALPGSIEFFSPELYHLFGACKKEFGNAVAVFDQSFSDWF